MVEYVILVDEHDIEIGLMEKQAAHEHGLLHRAFSVLVFNAKGELLLQKRSQEKYHSPGLWTNTCCSHPRSGETVVDAGKRRLQEELGFTCPLEEVFVFTYRAEVEDLIEHEIDHVLIGYYEGPVDFNEKEVQAIRWLTMEDIEYDIALHPDCYTPWFRILFPKAMMAWKDR